MNYSPLFTSKIPEGLTFDDVLLIPQHSDISSRSEIKLKSKFSKNVPLNIPIVSSPMDTVTEQQMAIEMARLGGLGIIHRYCSIEDQCKMVRDVKRAESAIIRNPYTVSSSCTIGKLEQLCKEMKCSTFLVTDDTVQGSQLADHSFKHKLVGIITRRDIRSASDREQKVKELMTPRENLQVIETQIDKLERDDLAVNLKEAKKILLKSKIEKIPVVSIKNEILGLITLKDLVRHEERPLANIDPNEQLYVGAAVGAKDDYLDRAKKLIDAGADVLVVDIANGHSTVCIDAVKMLKEQFKIDIVAGSIATSEGALPLIEAGADGIRCGIGSGSICTTRIVAGSGVPQLTALLETIPVCKKYNVPLISDGGNRNSGNMCKALATGAQCVMLGRLIAGCDESPGQILLKDGKRVKIYRGMAGFGANLAKAQKMGTAEPGSLSFTPEGVEGYIPYIGPLKEVLNQFTQGIKSGMSYCGAHNIPELPDRAHFVRLTQSSIFESGVHDIHKI